MSRQIVGVAEVRRSDVRRDGSPAPWWMSAWSEHAMSSVRMHGTGLQHTWTSGGAYDDGGHPRVECEVKSALKADECLGAILSVFGEHHQKIIIRR